LIISIAIFFTGAACWQSLARELCHRKSVQFKVFVVHIGDMEKICRTLFVEQIFAMVI
jgi:hypothetical protein